MEQFHEGRSASHIGRKPAFGQTCSMKTLLHDGILHVGEKVLTLEFEGEKYYGDLRKDGTIMMRGLDDTPHIYATPVAWANHCCKMLNPESKPLNAWSSIRFKGKRLDSYKLKWYRAQKRTPNNNNNNNIINNSGGINGIYNSNNNDPVPNYINNDSLINNISNHISILNNNNDNIHLSNNQNSHYIHNSISSNSNNINNHNYNNMSINNCVNLKTTVINYEQLGTRGPHNTHNPNTMVKCIPFRAVDRIQPFSITVSTNALLLVDFHSHLVSGEVCGYLAGSWDSGQHMLTVTQSFPCRTDLNDESTAAAIEEEIRQDMEKRNLTLVGWYHSHQGKYSDHPTIKDIQNQIEHQITMKETPNGYTPCIGLICSPHDIRSDDDLSPSFQIYWVMPPPESMSNHYGRPMQMYYSVTRDLFLTQDLLLEMRLLATYYIGKATDMVDFKSLYQYDDRITNLDKLSGSIKTKLPKDLQESEYPDEPAIWKAAVDHFWKFLRNLVIPQPDQANDQSPEGSPDQQPSNQQNDQQADQQSELQPDPQADHQADEQQEEVPDDSLEDMEEIDCPPNSS